MASSGTYAWAPDIQDFIDEAFERAGVDPAKLVARHLRSARMSLNLMFSDWATKDVHNWAVDEQTQTLTDGDASYTPATGTMVMLQMVIRRDGVDTPVRQIDRDAYHAIPNKTQEGLPTQLFFDRKADTYYLWNTPENSTDVLRYWRMRRVQDVTAGTETPDVPHYWWEALASGLAAKLALKYAPDRLATLKDEAKEAFDAAKLADRQRTNTGFSMRLG